MAETDPIEDRVIQHQFFLVQLGVFYGEKIDPILDSVRDYISAQLAREGDIISTKKDLKELDKRIKKRTLSEFGKFSNEIEKSVTDISAQEVEFYAELLTEGIIDGPKINEAKTSDVVRDSLIIPMAIGAKGAGVTLRSMIDDYAPRESKLVIDRINMGFTQGESTSSIAKAINGTKRNRFKDGLLNISRTNARSMAATEMPQISTTATQLTDRRNSSVVVGYRLVAVLDKKTSDTCKAWDGTEVIYAKGGLQPHPPFHRSCRTTETPIIDNKWTIRTDQTRIAAGAKGLEEVSNKTTYYKWLKRQPAGFQDEALGKERGLIFRNAGLSTEEFKTASVNKLRQPLNLDQMARKNKEINTYLNK